MSELLAPTDRTTLRRNPEHGGHDRERIHAVLDEGMVAHVGICVEGQPYVLPMAYGRDGDRLVLHGSVASRLLRGLDHGLAVCVTVTVLDGLVLARSTFHHSMNYRSVVVLGTAVRVTDPEQAAAALEVLVDHVVPGRTAEARPPTPTELRQTAVLVVPIEEASIKERTGGARDEPEDLDLPVWAGVLPLSVQAGSPVPDADVLAEVPTPASIAQLARPSASSGGSSAGRSSIEG
jgi:nitroimidazol reductase NimA-like FMN-containing flavoprotein (pyridoxamine 5'-phosphate oxidase superfamily)